MRPNELFQGLAPGLGGGAVALYSGEWLVAVALVLVGLFVWDVRRAKGLSNWGAEVVKLGDKLTKSKDDWTARRAHRRMLRLVEKQKRRDLRRESRERDKES